MIILPRTVRSSCGLNFSIKTDDRSSCQTSLLSTKLEKKGKKRVDDTDTADRTRALDLNCSSLLLLEILFGLEWSGRPKRATFASLRVN